MFMGMYFITGCLGITLSYHRQARQCGSGRLHSGRWGATDGASACGALTLRTQPPLSVQLHTASTRKEQHLDLTRVPPSVPPLLLARS